jgi:hypothetical protein
MKLFKKKRNAEKDTIDKKRPLAKKEPFEMCHFYEVSKYSYFSLFRVEFFSSPKKEPEKSKLELS